MKSSGFLGSLSPGGLARMLATTLHLCVRGGKIKIRISAPSRSARTMKQAGKAGGK